MKTKRFLLVILCSLSLALPSAGQGRPNTISAAKPITTASLNGRTFSISPVPVKDIVIAVTDIHLNKVYDMALSGQDGYYRFSGLPAGEPLHVYAWDNSGSQFLKEDILLHNGEDQKKNLYLTLSSQVGSVVTAPGTAGEDREIIEQVDFLFHHKPTTPVHIHDPWAEGIPFATETFGILKRDIEGVEYPNDNGLILKTWAPFNISIARAIFRMTFGSPSSLADYGTRKETYKKALYELAWQDDFDILNFMDENNGTTSLKSVEQAVAYLNALRAGGHFSLAGSQALQGFSNFGSLMKSGSDANFEQMVNILNQKPAYSGMQNFGEYLSVLSTIVNTIQISDAAVKTFYAPSLIEAAQYDLARLRLERLAQYRLIDDVAYEKALEEVLGSYETLPSTYWEKVGEQIRRNHADIDRGLISMVDLSGNILSLGSYSGGPWIGAIVFAVERVKGIHDWNQEFRKKTCMANIYGNLLEVTNQNSWLFRDLIEYAEYNYYSTFAKCMNHLELRVLNLVRPDQKELKIVVEKSRDDLLEKIMASRIAWYEATFPKQNTHTPVVVGLILDSSGSMADSDPNNIRVTATQKIAELMKGSEKVFVIDFDNVSRWINGDNFENWDREKLKQEIATIDASGGTEISSGILKLQEVLEKNVTGKYQAGVLMLSDGRSDYHGEAQWFADQGIPIYTVSYKELADQSLLSRIAAETGGSYTAANDENDVVKAFQSFYDGLFGNDRYITCSDQVKSGHISDLCSFYVDPNSEELIGNLNWTSGRFDLTLTAPSGQQYPGSAASAQVIRGPGYTILRIPRPEEGSWQASAKNTGQGLSEAQFVFQVSGKSALKLSLSKNSTDQMLSYTLEDPTGQLDLKNLNPSLTVSTPDDQLFDISKSYSSGSFRFIPVQGPGTYKINMNFTGNLVSGKTIQRDFEVSEYVGNYVPSYISNLTSTGGNFYKAPLGKDAGNYVGMRCYLYGPEGSRDNPKAIGMVTMVTGNECYIDIVKEVSFEPVTPTDIIELDKVQWQNDKIIKIK